MTTDSKEETKFTEPTTEKPSKSKKPAALATGEAKVETVMLDDPGPAPDPRPLSDKPWCFVDECRRYAEYEVSASNVDGRHFACAHHLLGAINSYDEPLVLVSKV